MMRLIFIVLTTILAPAASAFEIFALGTSNTNCRDVDRARTFTAHLQELLRTEGFDATVVNGGVNGDRPALMLKRMQISINPNTKLVVVEPGWLDFTKSMNTKYSERILAELQARNIPAIYVSNVWGQPDAEARESAKKYGAYYYGPWGKNVPQTSENWQWDGHMTAAGCQLWAEDMLPLVKQVIQERGIK